MPRCALLHVAASGLAAGRWGRGIHRQRGVAVGGGVQTGQRGEKAALDFIYVERDTGHAYALHYEV